jgi:hypothetical protein
MFLIHGVHPCSSLLCRLPITIHHHRRPVLPSWTFNRSSTLLSRDETYAGTSSWRRRIPLCHSAAGRRRHLLTWSHSSSTSVGNLCRASTAHLHPPLLRSCPLYLGPVVSPSVCPVSSLICGDVPYERKASVITVRHFGTRAPGARFFKLPTFKIWSFRKCQQTYHSV